MVKMLREQSLWIVATNFIVVATKTANHSEKNHCLKRKFKGEGVVVRFWNVTPLFSMKPLLMHFTINTGQLVTSIREHKRNYLLTTTFIIIKNVLYIYVQKTIIRDVYIYIYNYICVYI